MAASYPGLTTTGKQGLCIEPRLLPALNLTQSSSPLLLKHGLCTNSNRDTLFLCLFNFQGFTDFSYTSAKLFSESHLLLYEKLFYSHR
jgi:hypothetical protein